MAHRQQERRRQAARRATQRDERRARHQSRKRVRRSIYLAISGVIALLVIISLFLPNILPSRPADQGEFVRGEGPGEVFPEAPAPVLPEGIPYEAYSTIPPTSGPHWEQQLADWRIHTEPIPNEVQVHNLKYGGVAIQYNTEDIDLITQLEEFAEKQPDYPCYLLVAPYPDMESTIALTAWLVRDTMDTYDESQLQAFVDAYRDQGPMHVPCEP